MKAIYYRRFGGTEVLEYGEQPLPEPRSDELLIKVHASALNPIDCEVRKGKLALLFGRRFPRIPGCDFAGEVVRKGKQLDKFQPGDLVYGMSKTWKGRAHAEFICMKEGEIGLKPGMLNMVEAAAMPLAALTALQALRDLGHIRLGHKVLINGASGGVGVFAVQIAKAFGAEVIAVCSSRNIELVASLGADRIIDYTQQPIRELDEQFDLFFDVYGNQAFSRVRHLLRPKGRHVTTIPSPSNFVHHGLTFFARQKTKVVVVSSKTADLEILRQLVKQQKLRPVVDRILPLEAASEAQTYLETRRAQGKVVLTVAAIPPARL